MTIAVAPPPLQTFDLPLRINFKEPEAVNKIAFTLTSLIIAYDQNYRKLQRLVLCIGSDRSTGDALGPLVGERLSSLKLPRTAVIGTLAEPVHALNLKEHLKRIELSGKQTLVIAVDAALGKPDSIGVIEIGRGPLHPGAGVNKKLPPVGHIYLSGIVNLGGFMEQMVLQSTRLFHVMKLADVISRALQQALLQT
ncbi:MAG: spore protease YyaC [Firmicutes bacterium]|jgi:putative sporulation protein YyaC|nr:spore protease YyaC [Bacillota bacterium]